MRNILSCVKWSTSLTRPFPQCRHCSGSGSAVRLQCDDYNDQTDPSLSPLVISHGMLGSRHNWTSIAKQLHKSSGRMESLCSDIIYRVTECVPRNYPLLKDCRQANSAPRIYIIY